MLAGCWQSEDKYTGRVWVRMSAGSEQECGQGVVKHFAKVQAYMLVECGKVVGKNVSYKGRL